MLTCFRQQPQIEAILRDRVARLCRRVLGGGLEFALAPPAIEIFGPIARPSTMLVLWDGAADVL